MFIVPAARSPFKPEQQPAAADVRLRLLRLAFAGENRCELDTQELDRDGVSYSIDTIRAYAARFPEAKLSMAIEGTDLSYEDLAMRFLYWPKGIVDGVQEIKGQECWVVRLANPTQAGRYVQVRVWVHKKSQALMQVVGYNAGGRPLKRFAVTDVMKVGNTYTLRRMRVDTIDPQQNRVVGMTYLEFDKPKATGPKPGGLR